MKILGGFYYVNGNDGSLHECRACGRFRNENIKPLVGDFVEFSTQNGLEYGYVEDVFPRENELLRPPVANVDMMLLVVSATKPHIDFLLADKLLIQAERAGIEPVICVNKTETGGEAAAQIAAQYSAYPLLCVSAMEKSGMAELAKAMECRCVCFTGQSAVGKSSLLNALDEALKLEVGGLSKKTDRGKHTTRVVELLYLPRLSAYIFDTPGFSMLTADGFAPEAVARGYREFAPYAEQCRFASCAHDKEPDCGVKRAVEAGEINRQRYERYLQLLSKK